MIRRKSSRMLTFSNYCSWLLLTSLLTLAEGFITTLPSTSLSINNVVVVGKSKTSNFCDLNRERRVLVLSSSEDNNEDSSKVKKSNLLTNVLKWMKSDEAKEDFQVYIASFSIALLLRFLIIEPRYIPSLSMYPTFDIGDQLAVEKVTKRLRPFNRNEVVVFNPPKTFQEIMTNTYNNQKKSKEALIKRIVAVEGDEVRVVNGKLYINDMKQDEPFTAEDAAYEFGPVLVPKGSLLVLGDNRNHSLDGHIWGFLPKENVIGRAVFVYWPPWRIGNDGMF